MSTVTAYTANHGKQIKAAFTEALNKAGANTPANHKRLSDVAIKVAKKDRVSFRWFFENDTNLPAYCDSMVGYIEYIG